MAHAFTERVILLGEGSENRKPLPGSLMHPMKMGSVGCCRIPQEGPPG